MIRVGVLGASGYTGIECVRLLHYHCNVTISHLFAQTAAGKPTSHLIGDWDGLPKTFEIFDPNISYDIDCLFIALPHTTVHPMMAVLMTHGYKIIDLSADFRLNSSQLYNHYYKQSHQFTEGLSQIPYGCVEYYQDDIKQAKAVANPGCYALTTVLALKPLTDMQLVDHVVVDAKSGVSGAGKGVQESLMYCEVNDHVSAYKTNQHRHMAEFEEQCPCDLVFSPHLLPMSRGILASCYIQTHHDVSYEDILKRYHDIYSTHPFVRVCGEGTKPTTQSIVGSNMCEIIVAHVSERRIIVFSALDNLIKGSAGNAIHIMNSMFGLKETTGLPQLAQRI